MRSLIWMMGKQRDKQRPLILEANTDKGSHLKSSSAFICTMSVVPKKGNNHE